MAENPAGRSAEFTNLTLWEADQYTAPHWGGLKPTATAIPTEAVLNLFGHKLSTLVPPYYAITVLIADETCSYLLFHVPWQCV